VCEILEGLAVEHPEIGEYKARRAEAVSDLSTSGRLPEALDAEGRALAVREQRSALLLANTDYQYMVASQSRAMG
jgi:hypothetical protein